MKTQIKQQTEAIQIPTSVAIERYRFLTAKMETTTIDQLAAVIEDRHRLLVAVAAKAGMLPKKGWRVRTLAWMDDQCAGGMKR